MHQHTYTEGDLAGNFYTHMFNNDRLTETIRHICTVLCRAHCNTTQIIIGAVNKKG